MKQFSLSLSLLLLFIINGHAQDTGTYPVFVLNDSFSHAQPKESTIKPQKYQLSSLAGFKLDCSKYDFSLIRTLNGGNDPDAIFIVAKSGNFLVELNIKGVTTIDASTMYSIDNPKKQFKNFEKGDTPLLGIGTLKMKDGAANMQAYWISMIDVK